MSVWCCSDIHGYYSFYEQIKTIINPEDKVICLGDCGDRGPHSWKTLKAILSDPQIILLKGNHEDILAKALKAYIENDNTHHRDIQLCWANGGINTFLAVTSEERDILEVIKVLNSLPLKYNYTNKTGKKIFLSHAGMTPGKPYDLLWDREHFWDAWPKECNIDLVVHGHTPIQNYQDEDITEPYIYCDGHKINIDAGSYIDKKGILLNLDTLDYVVLNLRED